LERQTAADGTPSETDVPLRILIAADIQQLSNRLMTSPTLASLLTKSTPELPIHLEGGFNLGVKSNQSWNYLPNISIDWVVNPEIKKTLLIELMASLTSGKGQPSSMSPQTASKTRSPQKKQASSARSQDTTAVPSKEIVVNFNLGTSYLDHEEKEKLKEWIEQFQDRSEYLILYIEGHTDLTGSRYNNQEVSLLRANAVYDYLSRTHNFLWKYVVVKGFGASQPVKPGESDEANRQNRRVEVYVRTD
jgi:outer membrane protein OmpA-like peptidoglycan-associated protein